MINLVEENAAMPSVLLFAPAIMGRKTGVNGVALWGGPYTKVLPFPRSSLVTFPEEKIGS